MGVRGRGGFTLIELLVVVAIVALLVGVMVPALGAARVRASGVRGLAAGRTLMTAYAMYAGDHRGAVVPGYLPPVVDGEAVVVWDEAGNEWGPPTSQRWVYRLGPWFDYGWAGTTHIDERARRLRDRMEIVREGGEMLWAYEVSVYPSFGINYRFVGGNLANPVHAAEGYHITRIDQALRPSRLMVFCTARFTGLQGEIVEGFHRVDLPARGAVYREEEAPALFGQVHPRYGGTAAAAQLDGSGAMLTPAELLDATRWADPAARAGDADWRP